MKSLYAILLTAVFVLSLNLAQAQEDKWEGGLFIGASNYMGDLVETDIFTLDETNLAFGFLIKYSLNETLGLRLGLMTGQLTGDDLNADETQRKVRGFSFENRITELSLLGQWEPLGANRYKGGAFNRILSPYVFAGVGLGFSNPTTDFNGRTSMRITEDRNADVQKALFTTPFGIGLRYDLSQKWNIGLEMGLRPVFNDYLDGVSVSGNPDDNDWFTFGGLTLTTRFGAKDTDGDGVNDDSDECPTVPGLSSLKGCPDTDLDGIADGKDACPEVAGEMQYNGCPDTDGDGVADHQDSCPDVAGLRRFKGCPDTDGDGIPDPTDLCPNEAGVPSADGCPDADGDSIADRDDTCPNLAGPKSNKGCPDTDGDGINDPDDKCPTVAGLPEYSGCLDTDGDGIGDGDDACPTNPGPASNNGCPVVQEEDLAKLDFAMQNVRFRTASSDVLQQSYRILDEVAEIMTRYPNYKLKISGYTDNVGSDVANQTLSENRAKSCFQYLLVKGVDRSRITHAGFGSTNPIDTNDTPEGRARNRRVEFTLELK